MPPARGATPDSASRGRTSVPADNAAGKWRPGMNDGRFNGTERYVATDDLALAVNAAATLGRPLLVKGEPGTGKTHAGGQEVARRARAARSDRMAHQVDDQGPARDSTNTTRCRGCAIPSSAMSGSRISRNYIKQRHAVGGLRLGTSRPVLLIDEIDKEDIEFPERPPAASSTGWSSIVYETQETMHRHAPVPSVIITSEQREGAAGRLSPALLLPLHPLSRRPTRWSAIVERPFHPGIKKAAPGGRRWPLHSSRSARRQRGSRRSPPPPSCSTG